MASNTVLSFAPWILLLGITMLLGYRYIILPRALASLSRVPNAHWSCPYTMVWILNKRYRHQELHAVHKAHQKHGPIVRTGPRELSVSCWDQGIRTIYGGGFDKPSYYDFFTNYEFVPLFEW